MTSSTRSARWSVASPDLTLDPAAARELLAGPTLAAARRLLGATLVRGDRLVRIVEVEAYIGTEDLASHARFGRTRRTAVMFGRPGVAYVYLVYGMYHCLNVVTEPEGRAAAVLIRAAEALAGDEAMQAARERHRARHRPGTIPVSRLASGPGVLAAALSIDRSDDGTDLLDPGASLRLELPAVALPEDRIGMSPRIGIGYAPEPWRSRPWRLFDRASPAVSGPGADRRG